MAVGTVSKDNATDYSRYARCFLRVPIPPVLPVEILYGSPRPRMELVPLSILPERLQPLYSHREPIALLTESVGIRWGDFEHHARAGVFFDGPSYPWWARLFGVSRFERNLQAWLGALPHDCGYKGLDAMVDDHALNRLLYDWMLRDLWLFRGMSRDRADRRYRIVRRVGWSQYRPRPELHDAEFYSVKQRPEVQT
jgi:hypothetical protein